MATPRLCIVDDCGKVASGQYCQMHRARLKRGGTLERRQPKLTIEQLLAGQLRFGMWTVLGEGKPYRRPTEDGRPHPDGVQRTVNCRCDCGTERTISVHVIKRGGTRHCGCKMAEITAEHHTTHGLSKSPEYRTWSHMKERCSNTACQDWPDYGGRGIRVCERWANSFEAFYADMGLRPDGHSIDRIDHNGHYEPGNCRWADDRMQANNRRTTVMVHYQGVNLSLAEALRNLGLQDRYKLIHSRMRKGQSFEQAIAT